MTVKFSDIRPKQTLTEGHLNSDPPVVLILRRTAIRLFPGGERVAKYKNDNYDIEVAIPYNPKTLGKALISTAVTESTADNLLGSYITHTQNAAQHDKHFKPLNAIKRIVAKRYGQNALKHFTNAGDKYAAGEHGANRHYAKFKSEVDATGADKIHEAAIHQIHTITKTRSPADVSFKSGGSARVTHQQAAAIMRLHTVMKPENKAKIETLVNSGPDGLAKVSEFASTNLQ